MNSKVKTYDTLPCPRCGKTNFAITPGHTVHHHCTECGFHTTYAITSRQRIKTTKIQIEKRLELMEEKRIQCIKNKWYESFRSDRKETR